MKRRHFILIQLLLWLMVFFCMSEASIAGAATPDAQVKSVQTLEDAVFAIRYDQEPAQARVERLEKMVFGQVQTGSLDQRIGKLEKALSSNALSPLKETPPAAAQPAPQTQNAMQQPANQAAPVNQSQQQAYQPRDATDYPTVTQMEKKVFGKSFTSEDISQRLTRLEKQVFKTPQNGSLADRMDNLRLVILGDTGPSVAETAADPYNGYRPQAPGSYPQPPNYQPYPPQQQAPYYAPPPQAASGSPGYVQVPPGYQQMPGNGYPPQQLPTGYQNTAPYPPQGYPQQQAYGDPYAQPYGQQAVSPDMLEAMNEIEKETLGQTFPAEPFESRLDRVESKIFGQTAPELSADERMQRVIAVASAGGAPQTAKAKAKSTMMNILPIILTILPLLLL